ncbi:hypothetical protein LZ198_19395 [Myxococcus sp. K15C18031901]|uniref:hypothetical protein n=1 Tax=Myxococcus dinghuensis TaxID=2906761 RepID=UPI0020A829D4|nr:hypothetical protein [Myxococcus dinghuensis]MCP3101044.1 hypothetical protein [Myxococcus dinghuensis]
MSRTRGLTEQVAGAYPRRMGTPSRLVAAWWLAVLGACAAPAPQVPPVAPEGSTPAGPLVPQARALFEGCTPFPDGVASRTYRCGDLTLWISEHAEAPVGPVLARARARVERRLGEGVAFVEGELPLAGRPWPSARFAQCQAPGDMASAGPCRAGGYVTSVAGRLGRQRELGCVARENARPLLARCLELFEYLATHGDPEGEPLDAATLLLPPRLPWRALAVPPGCHPTASTSRLGRIECADASLTWSVYRPARTAVTERWLAQSLAELRESLPGAGPVEEVSCRLEQLFTRCARFTVPSEKGPLVVWAGAVEWVDRALFAACAFPPALEPAFPSVCNGAFSRP